MRESASTRRFLDVEELASRWVILAGFVDPESMPRLLEVVTSRPSPIAYRIAFARDASGRPRMSGRAEGVLPLVCQRCLENFEWKFDSRFESLVVGHEREESRGLDAVVCSGGRIELESVIEDELLLALPNAPVHTFGTCEAPPIRTGGDRSPSRSTSPFAALRELRSQQGPERFG